MSTPVKSIPPDAPLEASLPRILSPLGLGFSIHRGMIRITSEESVDRPVGEDLFLRYRDILQE